MRQLAIVLVVALLAGCVGNFSDKQGKGSDDSTSSPEVALLNWGVKARLLKLPDGEWYFVTDSGSAIVQAAMTPGLTWNDPEFSPEITISSTWGVSSCIARMPNGEHFLLVRNKTFVSATKLSVGEFSAEMLISAEINIPVLEVTAWTVTMPDGSNYFVLTDGYGVTVEPVHGESSADVVLASQQFALSRSDTRAALVRMPDGHYYQMMRGPRGVAVNHVGESPEWTLPAMTPEIAIRDVLDPAWFVKLHDGNRYFVVRRNGIAMIRCSFYGAAQQVMPSNPITLNNWMNFSVHLISFGVDSHYFFANGAAGSSITPAANGGAEKK